MVEEIINYSEALVSIIVPVYNAEKYLHACVDSILGQTYGNLEIILVDDGSKDASGSICDQYAKRDSRICVIHKENGGVASARNAGLRAFRGKYVMFVDSDDTIVPEAVRLLCERINTDKSDLVIAKHVRVLPNGVLAEAGELTSWIKDSVLTLDEYLRLLGCKKPTCLALWGKLFRREVLEDIIVPNLTCGEDAWIFPEYISCCKKISIEEAVLYQYWCRDGSITNQKSQKTKMDSICGDLHVILFYLKADYLESARVSFSYAINTAVSLENRVEGRRLFLQSISKKDLELLLKEQPIRVKIKWLSLYIPIIYFIYVIVHKVKAWLRVP